VVYVLAEEKLWRRDVLQMLGAADPTGLDSVLARTASRRGTGQRRRPARAARAAEIEAFATATGG
jgi:hypothetical protein